MADESKNKDRGFPSPDEFDSYDEVESEDGQAELPEDSFDGAQATETMNGCECN